MTDHKAEAERIMNLAHDNADQDHMDRASHQMQRSQVHATLYLAEQQRIANLIAYKSQLRSPGDVGFGSWGPYNLIIEKGLGLK